MPHGRRYLASLAGGVVVLVALTGCAGQEPTSSPAEGNRAAALGATGGMAGTAGMAGMGLDLPAPPESADWNLADATYLSMMIGHHRQALDLAELAETRAEDPRVRAIARAIDVGQSREIVVMAGWLVDRGLPEPTLDDIEAMYATAGSPGGMVGMLSPDALAALAAADGADFDRLFLEGMVAHHRGAIGMADEVLASGENVRVTEMATEVVATQSAEIDRLGDLLR